MSLEQAHLDELETVWKREERPIPIDDDIKDVVINTLSVEDLGFLKPHEETHLIGKLRVAEGILKEKKFTWPIFSDRRTGVILDGMHRWNLLKDFCFRYVPVQHIDYVENDNILLDVWCRAIMDVSEEEFQLTVREMGLEEVPFSKDGITKRSQAMIISPNNRAYIIKENMGPQNEYYLLNKIEARFGINKKVEAERAEYAVERKVMKRLDHPETVAVFPRPLSKKDVIDMAMRGDVFPPKTTRHIFQFRVFNIEVFPMDLQVSKSHEVLAQEMRKLHRTRNIFYIGKGINIDRYYEEHMFRFE